MAFLIAMTNDPHFLVIWHSRTGASEQMAGAVAKDKAGRLVRARDVTAEMLLRAAGFVFAGPENLGSLSGEMKEMFDRTYYPVLGKIEGRPYATIIAAGSDGEGAQRQIDRIVTGWRLRRIQDRLIVNFEAQTAKEILSAKRVNEENLKKCRDIGAVFGEGLRLGVF